MPPVRPMPPRIHKLCTALMAALCLPGIGYAQTQHDSASVSFEPRTAVAQASASPALPSLLLGGSDFTADMYTGVGAAAPGTYQLDVYFNNQWVEARSLELRADASGAIQPCLDRTLLAAWGVDLAKVDRHLAEGTLSSRELPQGAFCDDLKDFIPEASVIADVAQLRLDVTVPHLYAARVARDWVDPSQWDDGITAGVLRYNVNAYRDENNGQAQNSASATLSAGLNVGAWRLRHDGSARWNERTGMDYTPGATYLQRSIRALGAQLQLGQGYSRGDLFSSVPFTGAQIYSDDRMLPSSQRGYAPTIRGVANGNSRVSIYQQGRLIHEMSVTNGPFEINDLYATPYGGDLEIVVTAANGAEQRFTQSYAAVPQLLRPGQNRFSAVAGRVRSWNGGDTPYLVEGTWRRGISNAVTGYGGLRVSDGYQGGVLGAAVNLPFGALATDVTVSQSRQADGRSLRGQSYRVTYSKDLFARRTNVALAAYRYSTEHFRDLADHIRDNQPSSGVVVSPAIYRQRSRFDLNVSQRLPDGWGSVWVSGNTTTFWDRPQAQAAYSVGYNNRFGSLTLGLNAQRSRTTYSAVSRNDTQIGLSISMPLGVPSSAAAPRLNLDANHGSGGQSYRAGVSGNVRDGISYGVSADSSRKGGVGVSANASYRGQVAEISSYYTRNKNNQSVSFGAQGGVVIHSGGATFASSLGETVGLVRVDGGTGARINQQGMVDRRGYTVLGGISPYRVNAFEIDVTDAPDTVSMAGGAKPVAPTLGAVVPVVFETKRAAAARLVIAIDDKGNPAPFGASVTDLSGQVVGMVGQAGQMWLSLTDAETSAIEVHSPSGVLTCALPEATNLELATANCVRSNTSN